MQLTYERRSRVRARRPVYERELELPIKNALFGDLLSLLLIQVHKAKVDVARAMLALDKKEYEQGMQEYATALSQWRQQKASREQLTAAIASVKDLLTKAGQKQYANVWETEATQLIR